MTSMFKCWCGAEGAFDEMFADGPSSCGGLGYNACMCGGDFCVCHNHGTIECFGCWDCEPPDIEWDDEDDYESEDPNAEYPPPPKPVYEDCAPTPSSESG